MKAFARMKMKLMLRWKKQVERKGAGGCVGLGGWVWFAAIVMAISSGTAFQVISILYSKQRYLIPNKQISYHQNYKIKKNKLEDMSCFFLFSDDFKLKMSTEFKIKKKKKNIDKTSYPKREISIFINLSFLVSIFIRLSVLFFLLLFNTYFFHAF